MYNANYHKETFYNIKKDFKQKGPRTMNNKEIKARNYKESRKRWAEEQAELFLEVLDKTGKELGTELSPMQYVKAYKICIEGYQFEYPSEFKIAELISTDENYELALSIMTAVISQFRQAFANRNARKKGGTERRKRSPRVERAA